MKSKEAYKIRYRLLPYEFKQITANKWHDIFNEAVPVTLEKLKQIKAGDAKATLSELGTIMGIATDKMQVLTGNPDTITGYKDMSDSLTQLQAERIALMQELGVDEDIIDAEIVGDAPGETQVD